jgi:hypothetical protein
MASPTPEKILDTGMGFMRSKTLLSAVELGLFTKLGSKAMTGAELRRALGLAVRADPDFFDGLLAMGFLERDGDGAEACYRNTLETALFLDRTKPTYIGGLLEMANARLYPFWGDLTEGLKTGTAQNEVKRTGKSLFAELYSDPARLEQFMAAMAGISAGPAMAFAEKFDFSRYKTMCDVGGATGVLSMMIARRHPHLKCISADLPAVTPIATRHIAAAGLADRITAQDLDFFQQPLPKADVITMGLILHDWNLETKKMLIEKAYEALPSGGAFVAIENLIDDARRTNVFGLMMSLNMLIETSDGYDFTGAHFADLTKEAGFKRTEIIPLAGPASAAVAYK